MKYITVLDFEVGQVYQYNIEGLGFNSDSLHEMCELFITGKGHNLQNCEWMISNNNEIIEK
tara:strand:+ start:131 stop:313 length:183 start_codon:yes stop_codon:yes gene_type:complete